MTRSQEITIEQTETAYERAMNAWLVLNPSGPVEDNLRRMNAAADRARAALIANAESMGVSA
jgi:hypothetical protein